MAVDHSQFCYQPTAALPDGPLVNGQLLFLYHVEHKRPGTLRVLVIGRVPAIRGVGSSHFRPVESPAWRQIGIAPERDQPSRLRHVRCFDARGSGGARRAGRSARLYPRRNRGLRLDGVAGSAEGVAALLRLAPPAPVGRHHQPGAVTHRRSDIGRLDDGRFLVHAQHGSRADSARAALAGGGVGHPLDGELPAARSGRGPHGRTGDVVAHPAVGRLAPLEEIALGDGAELRRPRGPAGVRLVDAQRGGLGAQPLPRREDRATRAEDRPLARLGDRAGGVEGVVAQAPRQAEVCCVAPRVPERRGHAASQHVARQPHLVQPQPPQRARDRPREAPITQVEAGDARRLAADGDALPAFDREIAAPVERRLAAQRVPRGEQRHAVGDEAGARLGLLDRDAVRARRLRRRLRRRGGRGRRRRLGRRGGRGRRGRLGRRRRLGRGCGRRRAAGARGEGERGEERGEEREQPHHGALSEGSRLRAIAMTASGKPVTRKERPSTKYMIPLSLSKMRTLVTWVRFPVGL